MKENVSGCFFSEHSVDLPYVECGDDAFSAVMPVNIPAMCCIAIF